MKRSEQMRQIEERIAAVKDVAYDNLTAAIKRGPNLDSLGKAAAAMEQELHGFAKKADKVEEFTRTNADQLISSAAMYGLKNYAFNYAKMYSNEIGVGVAAIVAFQLITNPGFVFDTLGSVFKGLYSTVGNYTNVIADVAKNVTKTSASAEPKTNVTGNATLDVPFNKNITDSSNSTALPIRQNALDKYVDLDVKINATEPTYITHDGMFWLVTPYHANSGTLSE
jgi:hypothetical protein